MTTTFLVLGDQLATHVAPWPSLDPRTTVVLLIESDLLRERPGHLTRTALYLAAMRAFAEEVRDMGFVVDYRRAPTFRAGLAAHRADVQPERVLMNRPHGRRAQRLFTTLGVEQLPSPFFLTDLATFADRRYATMETFYRDQRRRLGVLVDGELPVGGRWNFDEQNRLPLPKDGGTWPEPWTMPLRPEEVALVAELRPDHPGGDALAYWPRRRSDALAQLHDAVTRILPSFGPYEDALSTSNWHLAHSRLSVALNLGLVHPREVLDAVTTAYQDGHLPLASAEGFVRQLIGWREWVWALHQVRDDAYAQSNALGATDDLPESWREYAGHPMACVATALQHLTDFGWTHHIERLMILTNAATLIGLSPRQVATWMAETFVDGAEWVMEANVIGMGTFADGGRTATKPYVSGGNYLKKMGNCCSSCSFDPAARTGERACPLTTLYWDFFLRHQDTLATVHRVAPIRRAAAQRPDREAIRLRAPLARAIVRGELLHPLGSRNTEE
jgi:deoxyribodipyrimidine photolyase-related protein